MNSFQSGGKFYLTTPIREEVMRLKEEMLDAVIPYSYDFSKELNAHRFIFNEELHFKRATFLMEKNARNKGVTIAKGPF